MSTYQIEVADMGTEQFAAPSDNEAARQIRKIVAEHPEWPDDQDVAITDPDGRIWHSMIFTFR